jgi:hypothetical protein
MRRVLRRAIKLSTDSSDKTFQLTPPTCCQINADYDEYLKLLAELRDGPMSTVNGMGQMSIIDAFCAAKASQGIENAPLRRFIPI